VRATIFFGSGNALGQNRFRLDPTLVLGARRKPRPPPPRAGKVIENRFQ
jgi:hypothetical protein